MEVVKIEVLKAAGGVQLCAGHEAGVEAAVHAMQATFENSATDTILFVDAANAFNNLPYQQCSSIAIDRAPVYLLKDQKCCQEKESRKETHWPWPYLPWRLYR